MARGERREGSYINGASHLRAGAPTFQSLNPATGEALAEIAIAEAEDLALAVAAAREGFRVWSRWTGTERGRVLARAARILRERVEPLARLEVQDCGKPLYEALSVDIPSAADALEYFAGLAPTVHGEHYQLGASFAYTRREPLGICAGIGAWNYPLQIAAWKAAPALAAGNAMIFKPSELSPLTALRLAEILSEAGLPRGVFNVLQGSAPLGKLLCEHPEIAKVSLTGSVATGRKVMEHAAATLKQVTLELGGKSPLIIFPDADLDQAVVAAILGNFFTQGEVCSNATRVFVHQSCHEAFLRILLGRMKSLTMGDPMNLGTRVGALISAAHRDKVVGYLRSGLAEGARLVAGGQVPEWGPELTHLRGGYYVSPAVFDCPSDDLRLVREEIFGPVMAVLSFDKEDEVVARANATPFGLAAGVFTRDLNRAHRVIAELEAGTCWINTYNVTPVEVPFGGMKQSGLGRENGLAAITHYTQLKSVYVEMGRIELPYAD